MRSTWSHRLADDQDAAVVLARHPHPERLVRRRRATLANTASSSPSPTAGSRPSVREVEISGSPGRTKRDHDDRPAPSASRTST